MKSISLLRQLLSAGPVILLLATAGAGPAPAQTASYLPPIPPQEARIWFYRDVDMIHTQGRPYLRLNGAIVAIAEPGGSFYRDVPPGHYHITVDSYGVDANQDRDVDLGPGQQVFAKKVSNDNWLNFGGGSDMGGGGGYHRDTFYVWTMPPQTAWAEMAKTRYFGGNTVAAAAPPR